MSLVAQHADGGESQAARRARVVIVGGGFAGVAAAKGLRDAKVDIIMLDRRNHQIFQPLLYQVATAVLAPSDIAAPLRQLETTQANLAVVLAEVTAIDLARRKVEVLLPNAQHSDVTFDFLILAPGVASSYFGHDDFASSAPGLKTLTDAELIRSKILKAYELAEATDDPVEQRRLTTFVIVGGGPTGVELAASIAHMAQVTLRGNFRRVRPEETTIVLLEGGRRLLPSFEEPLAAAAQRRLERLGVAVRTGAIASAIDAAGVTINGERMAAATVLWAAGVAASPLIAAAGVSTDRVGRAVVGPTLETAAGSGVFVIGDAASIAQDGKLVPGVAQAALQQGAYAASVIRARIDPGPQPNGFHYRDRGAMAVVGRGFAVLEAPGWKSSGALAWLFWAFIHVAFLPRLQNRLRVSVQWLWSTFTGQRGSRLITESTMSPSPPTGP